MTLLKTAFILVAVLTLPALAYSATIIVPDDHPTIQGAIDAAVNGDTVLVKPGTYFENIDFKGKAITVMSEQGADVTVIDGNQAGSVVTCNSGEDKNSILDGFTISNGKADGGGMYNENSSPTVMNCTFSENTTDVYGKGGGICNIQSNPTLKNCTFSGNETVDGIGWDYPGGGGMYNHSSSPTVTDCKFINNIAVKGGGGGIYNEVGSNPTVTNCTFSGNSTHAMYNAENCNPTVKNCIFSGNLCGMSNWYSSPTVENCTFTENGAPAGGGMRNEGGSPIVTNCIFSENVAYGWYLNASRGGGMYNDHSNPVVTNCTFSGNKSNNINGGSGGGIYITGNGISTITNCTFIGNEADSYGGGMSISGNGTTVTNCILWNDIPNEIHGTASVTYSNVQGGYPGTGNIDADPLFVDAANNDFHLTFNSPCRGSGDNSAVTEQYDFEGDPRICQGTVDIGADECYRHLYCMGDFTPGGAIEGRFIGLPGTTPVGLFVGTGVLPAPANTMWGEYWLQAPWILFGPLGAIPSDGVMVLPTTLPGSIPAPYDVPMQALIGLNADSLTNLFMLEVR